jgi:hypothetical protein
MSARRLLLIVLAVAGCAVELDPLPTCASLGCPDAPSGAADTWAPCDDAADVCYCPTATEVHACR